MNELIKVAYDNDRPTVSGRELHEFLEVSTKYADWFHRMCEYGFSDGVDYFSFLRNRSDGLPGKPLTDHQLMVTDRTIYNRIKDPDSFSLKELRGIARKLHTTVGGLLGEVPL